MRRPSAERAAFFGAYDGARSRGATHSEAELLAEQAVAHLDPLEQVCLWHSLYERLHLYGDIWATRKPPEDRQP